MGSNLSQKPSLLKKEFSTLFSPLRIHADILESDKRFALYKFTMLFFPNLGPSILNLLLDMEKHSQKIFAAIRPDEREKLIKELEGITVEMRYSIKEKGRELVVLPINISPVEVLKNAPLTQTGSRYDEKMQEEISKIVFSFIIKNIQSKIKTRIENSLKTLLAKPKVPEMLKELLSLGLINKEGLLAEGATIEDLVCGKYARLFKKVVPEDLVNETLLIQETLKVYYDWEGEDFQALASEALAQKGILEITLGEIGKK